MHYTKGEIAELDKVARLKLINAVSGIKAANLIGTVSKKGVSNLGVFNSVFHLGSNPPLQGFILRPVGEVPRHTYENFMENGQYTINHIHSGMIERAHYTSAKFEANVSEFSECSLTEEYVAGFEAPFVKESRLKMGMRFIKAIPIPMNDTLMIVGEIQHLMLPENAYGEAEDVDLERMDAVGISGLNTYYEVKKLKRFPYARRSEVPNFKDR